MKGFTIAMVYRVIEMIDIIVAIDIIATIVFIVAIVFIVTIDSIVAIGVIDTIKHFRAGKPALKCITVIIY